MNDFKEQFKVVEGLILENSFGVVKSEDDVVINVTIGYTSKDNYGWFEIYDENTGGNDWYAEGGLWFSGNRLSDYDGVFALPHFVLDCLEKKGFDVKEMR